MGLGSQHKNKQNVFFSAMVVNPEGSKWRNPTMYSCKKELYFILKMMAYRIVSGSYKNYSFFLMTLIMALRPCVYFL